MLSVFAGQTQFGPKDSPTFELSIVSTQPAECTFNIGSAHLALVIKEGSTRIWNSADCPVGTPSLDAALGRRLVLRAPNELLQAVSGTEAGMAGRSIAARLDPGQGARAVELVVGSLAGQRLRRERLQPRYVGERP